MKDAKANIDDTKVKREELAWKDAACWLASLRVQFW